MNNIVTIIIIRHQTCYLAVYKKRRNYNIKMYVLAALYSYYDIASVKYAYWIIGNVNFMLA